MKHESGYSQRGREREREREQPVKCTAMAVAYLGCNLLMEEEYCCGWLRCADWKGPRIASYTAAEWAA